MDVILEAKPVPLWKRYWYVVPLLLLSVSALAVNRFFGDASYVVDRKGIQLATVESGVFLVHVRGKGVLKPVLTQRISAEVGGRVDTVRVLPGTMVEKDQVLVTLSNPELHRQLRKAQWELTATAAEHNAERATLQSQLVDIKTLVLEAELNYQSAKLKLDAETQLLESNVDATLSKLDYEQTKLDVNHQRKRWGAQEQRYQEMVDTIAASADARKARLNLLQSEVNALQAQVDALTVMANRSGIVQEMGLVLGQQIEAGESVATIVDQSSLMAQLQIQELQVRDIAVGQLVTIDTRGSKIQGEVARIDPAVVEGEVQVDVNLYGELPPEARPDLNVEGMIEVANIDEALYVMRPAYVQRFSNASVYRLSRDENFIRRVTVNVGQSSVNQVQVLSGLDRGDRIVVSDTSDWNEHAEIFVN